MSETRTLRVIVVGNAKSAQKALNDLSGTADRTGSRVSSSGTKFGGTMLKMGKSAALGFGVAAGAAAMFTYKVGAPYEQALNKIQVLNGQTDSQMKGIATRLESNATNYAKLGLTVGDAAGGVLELSKAGMSLNDSMKAVNATMVLAKAGDMDAAEAAALVSNTLNTFSLSADHASDVANVLANAANLSSADVTDLAESLKYASPVAAGAGVSLHTLGGMLAELANAGIKGTNAGTGVRTMLLSLQAPSAAGKKALKALNVEINDAHGKLLPLPRVIDNLNKAMAGMSDADKTAKLKDIFGKIGITPALTVLKGGSAGLREYTKGVGTAGAAQKLAESRSKGLSGQVARLKAEFISLGQITYRALAPLATKALKPLADGIDKMLPKIAPGIAHLKGLLSGGAGGNAGGQFAKAGAAIKQFGASMLPTLSKFGSELKSTLGPGIKQIADLFTNQFLPAFSAFLPVVAPVAKFLLNILGGAVIGVLKGVINVVKGVLTILTGLFQVFTGILHGNWSLAWEGVKNILKGALQAVWGALQIWWNGSILAIFKRGALFLTKGIWLKMWDSLKGLGKQGVAGINSIIGKIFEFLTAPFRRGFAAVRGYVTDGWAYIRGKFSGGVGSIRAIVMRIIEVYTYPYRVAFAMGRRIVSAGIGGVVGLLKSLIGRASGALNGLKGAITGKFSGAIGWLKNAGWDVVRGLGNGIRDAAQAVLQGAINEVADKIPNWLKKRLGIASPSKVMAELGKWIPAGIAKGITSSSSVAEMRQALAGLADMITGMFKHHKISAKSKSHLLKILKENEKEVLTAVAKRLSLQGKLEAAQKELDARTERLQSLQDQKQSLVDSTRSGAMDKGSLMGTLAQDDSERNTVSAIMARFGKRLQAIQSFRANFNALKARGMSAGLLAQIAGAGPDEGGLMAATLMKATGAQLDSLNNIGASIEFESNGLATDAGSVYDAQIAQAQGAVDQQTQVVNNINVVVQGNVTAEQALAKTIAAQVRNEIERINKRNGKKK